MTIELNEYIEKLRPVAEFRDKLVSAMRGPLVTRESSPKERKERQLRADSQTLAAFESRMEREIRKERQLRADSQTLLIREAQRCGMLPAFLIPLIWKVLYAVAWQAIQYWLGQIHKTEGGT